MIERRQRGMIERRRRAGKPRSILTKASLQADCSLGDLTVLSGQVDPYRLDTRARHLDAQWIAQQFNELIGDRRTIHWRGLHYAIVARGDIRKPDGKRYRNKKEDLEAISGSRTAHHSGSARMTDEMIRTEKPTQRSKT